MFVERLYFIHILMCHAAVYLTVATAPILFFNMADKSKMAAIQHNAMGSVNQICHSVVIYIFGIPTSPAFRNRLFAIFYWPFLAAILDF